MIIEQIEEGKTDKIYRGCRKAFDDNDAEKDNSIQDKDKELTEAQETICYFKDQLAMADKYVMKFSRRTRLKILLFKIYRVHTTT